MNKTASIIITIGFAIGLGIMFLGQPQSDANLTDNTTEKQNIEIKDNVQYITIDAKGGYSPRLTTAKAGLPTKLIMRTNGTFDCSLALVIRSIDYQEMLEPKGEEIIDLGTPPSSTLQGMCSMGMYNFSIKFL